MLFSLKRFTAVAGIACAVAGAGPVALASAAIPVISPLPPATNSAATGTPLFPGLSCSVDQGLFPGFINLGPTGPLGPLGPYGPLGNTNNNLPCGAAVFNLGPSGPLGPGGALAGGQH